MTGRMRWVVLAVCTAIGGAGAQAPVRWGRTITPDTVTVGQPFRLEIRVRAPAGAAITFPDGPDSGATVQALDPRIVREAGDSRAVDQTAIYRLAAWDVGTLEIKLPDVVVRTPGHEEKVPMLALRIVVRSVLPLDSALRVPKPARGLIVSPLIPWWIVALILALVVAAIWWLRRRRRAVLPVAAIDPFARAEREFARIEALGLVEAGERGRFVTLMIEALRDYLAARYPAATLSLTSDELLAALREAPAVPHDALRDLMRGADLVKFERRTVSTTEALSVAIAARGIVAHEYAASAPPPTSEAEAA
jgi:hypothetical protein